MIPTMIIEDYETLRAAVLYEQKCQALEGIILLRHGMLKWCYEREKSLNEQAYTNNLTEPLNVISEEETKPLIHVIVNMINHIYEGGCQYGECA